MSLGAVSSFMACYASGPDHELYNVVKVSERGVIGAMICYSFASLLHNATLAMRVSLEAFARREQQLGRSREDLGPD